MTVTSNEGDTAMSWTTAGRNLPSDWNTRRRHVLERDPMCRLRYPGRCAGTSTEVDHHNPGSDHSYENLQGVCSPCHKTKTAGEAAAARARHTTKRPAEQHPGLRRVGDPLSPRTASEPEGAVSDPGYALGLAPEEAC